MNTIKLLILLWIGLSGYPVLATDPWILDALIAGEEQGIQARTADDALAMALGVSAEDVQSLYDVPRLAKYRMRLEGLETAGNGRPVLTPAAPLRVDSPLSPDTPMPSQGRIRKILDDKARRFLLKQGLSENDPAFAGWLERARTWMWQDVLVEAGPRYLVPLFNSGGDCVALLIVRAWKHPGSIASSLTACDRNYALLNREDAAMRLAEEGLHPKKELRAVFIPSRDERWPRQGCVLGSTRDDADAGVWTDGVHAVGIASGNVYTLSEPYETLADLAGRLEYGVRYVQAPDEDPRYIVPTYRGVFRLVGCGRPDRSDYAAVAPLKELPLSAMPPHKRSELLETQVGTEGGTRPHTTPEEARRSMNELLLVTGGNVGDFRSFFERQLPAWAREALQGLPGDTRLFDVAHLTEPRYARSLVRLPQNPPSDPLVRLFLDEVAAAVIREPVATGAAPTPELAREQTWAFARAVHASRYFANLVDDQGRCLLTLSVPDGELGGGFGAAIAPCPSPRPFYDAGAARKRFAQAGVTPQGELELVLIPTERDPLTPGCPKERETFFYLYWSDGRYAMNSQTGDLYRLLPAGLNYLTQTPEPYPAVFTAPEGAKFLVFFLPVQLEAFECSEARP